MGRSVCAPLPRARAGALRVPLPADEVWQADGVADAACGLVRWPLGLSGVGDCLVRGAAPVSALAPFLDGAFLLAALSMVRPRRAHLGSHARCVRYCDNGFFIIAHDNNRYRF